VIGTFSFGLIFFLLALPGILLPLLGGSLAGGTGVTVGISLMIIYFIFLSVVSSSTHGIFLAALYRYATRGEVSPVSTREPSPPPSSLNHGNRNCGRVPGG